VRPTCVAVAVAGFLSGLVALPVAAGPVRGPTSAQVREALGSAPPRAALIYDVDHDRELWGRRATRRLPPASLIKMLTALVAVREIGPETPIRFSRPAATTPYDRIGWRAHATFSGEDVMHGMLMSSSNGAAAAVAEHVAGTERAFARRAQKLAHRLGARETTVRNASGLHHPRQLSTARDLALIGAAVLADPWLSRIIRQSTYQTPWTDGTRATFANINDYLRLDPSAVGVKTGFTTESGNTIVAAATRDGATRLAVVLDSADPFGTAKRLIDLAFVLAPAPRAAPSADEEPPAAPATVVVDAEPFAPEVPATTPAPAERSPEPGGFRLGRLVIALGLMLFGARVRAADKRARARAVPRRSGDVQRRHHAEVIRRGAFDHPGFERAEIGRMEDVVDAHVGLRRVRG